MIVGDRTRIQLLALENENAVLVTGGFQVHDDVIKLANQKGIPVLRSKPVSYTHLDVYKRQVINMVVNTRLKSLLFLPLGLSKLYVMS